MSELTPAVMRAALARHGAFVVRGLFPRSTAAGLLDDVRRAFAAAAAAREGSGPDDPCYVPLPADREPHVTPFERDYCWELGTVLAADAPRAMAALVAAVRAAGVEDPIADFLGEEPALSAQKTSLRWVPPRPPELMRRALSLWHQDGAFLGRDIRALNVWTALNRCGSHAPALELLVGRPDDLVPRDDLIAWSRRGPRPAALRGFPSVRPELAPGDSVVFDHLTVHRTHIAKGMTRARYGVECWFFAPSTFPARQLPLPLAEVGA